MVGVARDGVGSTALDGGLRLYDSSRMCIACSLAELLAARYF